MGSALGRRDAGKAISICGGERERKGVTCQKDTKRKRERNRRIENETDRQAGRRYKLANIQSDKEGDKKEERHINKFTVTLNIQKGSDTKRRSQRRAAPAEEGGRQEQRQVRTAATLPSHLSPSWARGHHDGRCVIQ